MTPEARIGIITAFLGNLRAGTWTYTWNLLKRLREKTAVTAIDREQRPLAGLEGIALKAFPGGGKQFAKLMWPNFTLPDRAASAGFDLVHGTTPYGTFRSTKFKKIITICDVTPLLFPEAHGRMNVWHHRFVLPAILKQADHIITISEASKQDIIRCFKVPDNKITVTLLAADNAFRPDPSGIPSDGITQLPRPYILNVGTLEPRKNLEGLLRAFAAARHKGMPHSLVITGARGWGRSPLASLVRELALDDAVIFTGFVEDTDLPHLYGRADFFVYPSLYEGFGLPILEAMSCGTPVITSNVSSMLEVSGDAAILADPRSEAELMTSMLKLAGDGELRCSLRDKGMIQAARFSWERTAHETWDLYEQVLQGE